LLTGSAFPVASYEVLRRNGEVLKFSPNRAYTPALLRILP